MTPSRQPQHSTSLNICGSFTVLPPLFSRNVQTPKVDFCHRQGLRGRRPTTDFRKVQSCGLWRPFVHGACRIKCGPKSMISLKYFLPLRSISMKLFQCRHVSSTLTYGRASTMGRRSIGLELMSRHHSSCEWVL